MITCSIEGCAKLRKTRGWCTAHYEKWRKYGTPHGGKTNTPWGDPLRYFREVVLAYDGDDCLTWPYGKDRHGYGQVHINGRKHTVSRMVCDAVSGPPPSDNLDAAHSCGRGHLACVTKAHLSWKTRAENMADAIEAGTIARGERKVRSSKLKEADVTSIRSLRGSISQRQLAEQFGISQQTVSDIHAGKIWGWLR